RQNPHSRSRAAARARKCRGPKTPASLGGNFESSVLFVTTAMYRPYGLVALPDHLGHRLCGDGRNAGELDPRAAGLSHHKVHLGALARSFRRKLDHGARPCRDTFVQGVKRVAVRNLQCEVMQTDIATAVERHAFLRILHLPERHDGVSVPHERRRITLVLTNNSPAKAIAKEMAC